MKQRVNRLVDAHARSFEVLRLSITDACNFRCQYCLPNGYQKPEGRPSFLSIDEIENLVRAFARLGFWKLRLTGGEPTLRRDFLEIVERASGISGIERIALSTNGHTLAREATQYRLAGITHLNISLDSLDRKRFADLTGVDRMHDVLAGIDAAFRAQFQSVKVNAVLAQGEREAEEELDRFIDWVKARPISVRFIELMQTEKNAELFKTRHHSSALILRSLERRGWAKVERKAGDGPATEFSHSEYAGRIGVIAPYSLGSFCESCNRLRVSSVGGLRLCLFGEKDHDLRPLIQNAGQIDELCEALQSLVLKKPVSHYLKDGKYGQTRTFSEIGG